MGMHANWMTLGAGGLYGTDTVGRSSVQPNALSELDAVRMAQGRTPGASYPDGYLGTIRGRRDDKLLDAVKQRTSQPSYQRGVHKGALIGPQDYFWLPQFNPESGIRGQMKKRPKKFAPPLQGDLVPTPHLINDGKADARSLAPALTVDQAREQQLSALLPLARI